MGEAKSDAEAVLAIAEKLGMADELWEHWVYPPMANAQNSESAGTDDDDFVNQMEMSTEHVFGEPGFESLQLRSYTLGGCQEHMPYGEFLQKGYLPVRFKDEAEWKAEPIGMQAFWKDPENNPLATPTGKIEFYSTGIAQVWGDDGERPPVPKWIEESDEHHERLTNDRGKDYPVLMMSNHPRWRVHAEHDDITWLREIETCKAASVPRNLTGRRFLNFCSPWVPWNSLTRRSKMRNLRGWIPRLTGCGMKRTRNRTTEC